MKKWFLILFLVISSVRAEEKLIIDLNQNILVTNSVYKHHVLYESRDLTNWNEVTIITNNVIFTRPRRFNKIFYYTIPIYPNEGSTNSLVVFQFLHIYGGTLGVYESNIIPQTGELLSLKNDEFIWVHVPWKVKKTHIEYKPNYFDGGFYKKTTVYMILP